jgi:hypothetical protein
MRERCLLFYTRRDRILYIFAPVHVRNHYTFTARFLILDHSTPVHTYTALFISFSVTPMTTTTTT